jgi:heat shock protein HslJ
VTRHDVPRVPSVRAATQALLVVLAIVLVAPSVGACSAAGKLTGPVWQLTGGTEKVPPSETAVPAQDQARYTVTFADDGTAAITADCNNVTATYTTSSSQLDIRLGVSTLAACPDDSIADQFLAGLELATSFNVHGSGLTLYLGNEGTMELAAAQ